MQLSSSNGTQVANMSSHKLKDTIANIAGVNIAIPVNEFISNNECTLCLYKNKVSILWTRTRHVSQHLQMNSDISDTQNIKNVYQ